MIINCVIVTSSPNDYIARHFLENNSKEAGNDTPINLMINDGAGMAVVKKLNTTANYPGLDKSYIELEIVTDYNLMVGDWLSPMKTNKELRVCEIIKT